MFSGGPSCSLGAELAKEWRGTFAAALAVRSAEGAGITFSILLNKRNVEVAMVELPSPWYLCLLRLVG